MFYRCSYTGVGETVQWMKLDIVNKEIANLGFWENTFRTMELTATPNNLVNRVKFSHALDQSRTARSSGREIAH